jgi:hypothetical protein
MRDYTQRKRFANQQRRGFHNIEGKGAQQRTRTGDLVAIHSSNHFKGSSTVLFKRLLEASVSISYDGAHQISTFALSTNETISFDDIYKQKEQKKNNQHVQALSSTTVMLRQAKHTFLTPPTPRVEKDPAEQALSL